MNQSRSISESLFEAGRDYAGVLQRHGWATSPQPMTQAFDFYRHASFPNHRIDVSDMSGVWYHLVDMKQQGKGHTDAELDTYLNGIGA